MVKDNELGALSEALEGQYTLPGPGGDPIRNPGVLPTGKNIHALDPQSIPTQVGAGGRGGGGSGFRARGVGFKQHPHPGPAVHPHAGGGRGSGFRARGAGVVGIQRLGLVHSYPPGKFRKAMNPQPNIFFLRKTTIGSALHCNPCPYSLQSRQ